MLKIDMHVHSNHSFDGLMSVDDILRKVRKLGLDGVAIADHNSFAGSLEAMAKADGLIIIPAVEYSTDCGHVLAFFVCSDAKDILRQKNGKYDFFEVAELVKSQDGLLFAAHPYKGRKNFPPEALHFVDGLEVFNSRCVVRHHVSNDMARKKTQEAGKGFCAGSDAHTPKELGNACRFFDLPPEAGLEDIKKALAETSGSYFGKFSPLSCYCRSDLLARRKRDGFAGLVKGCLRFAAGLLIDAKYILSRQNKDLKTGKIYEI